MIRMLLFVLVVAAGAAGCADYGGEEDGGDGDDGKLKDFHEKCCVPDAAEDCDLGQCKEGLSCYVLPYGPYYERGICCASDTCILSCDRDDCTGGFCSTGEAGCPEELTCRNSGTPVGDACLP